MQIGIRWSSWFAYISEYVCTLMYISAYSQMYMSIPINIHTSLKKKIKKFIDFSWIK